MQIGENFIFPAFGEPVSPASPWRLQLAAAWITIP
jgi:hypothetical protein